MASTYARTPTDSNTRTDRFTNERAIKMGGDDGRSNQYLPRGALAVLLSPLLLVVSDCQAFCPQPPRLMISRAHQLRPPNLSIAGRERIKLHQLGGGGDYLSNLSTNDDEDEEASSSPMANVMSAFDSVSSEVGKRTLDLSSGFANVAERGSSDLQSLADGAKSGVEQAARKSTRDFRRSTMFAQKAVQKTSDGLTSTGQGLVKRTTDGLASTGQGFAELNFFREMDFAPKIEADEIMEWIDSQARSGTEMVGSKAKSLVLNFTGKGQYEFGDVTKELINRVASSDISLQDVMLLLKILLALGATLGPLAELLPFTILIEALNMSLEAKVGGQVVEVLSKALDNRLVAAVFTQDDKNLIGDLAKRSVLGGVLQFTGKSKYEGGDIQRAVQKGQEADNTEEMKLDLDVSAEFEEWDRLFVEKIETEEYAGNQAKVMDMKIAQALEECEAMQKRS